MRRTSIQGERGQAGLLMVLSLTFLFGVIGFSVDLGHFYYRKQVAQAAADAGALAAASYANDNGSGSQLVVTNKACGNAAITSGSAPYAGCEYAEATANGSYAAADITMTTANSVPTNAPGTPSTYWIQTTVSETLNSTFLRFFGHNSIVVRAEATAGIVAGSTGSQYCMYTLAGTTAQSFFASGSTTSVTLQNCGMAVNSSANSSSNANNNAYVLNGSASVTLSGTGAATVVHGGANVNGTYCGTTGVTCSAATVTDPLANLAAPGIGTCAAWNGLSPIAAGCYTGGINISSGTYVFSGGNYILNGGGLTISGANTTVTGSGVMFYNTGSSGHTIAPITLSGQANVTFSAPTTGTYKGILMFQDHNTTYSTANQINGDTSPSITGTLYFPGSSMLFTGTNSATPAYTVIIAQTITFNGGATFKWDSSGNYTGLAVGPTANLLQ